MNFHKVTKIGGSVVCEICGQNLLGHPVQEECLGALALEGRKDDTTKLPYHLLAPEFLEEVSRVLEFGANKYSARNWEKGMAWHRPFAALMRHMWTWWRGESLDAETGYSHLAHAACCIMFLLAYEKRKVGEDDRPQV